MIDGRIESMLMEVARETGRPFHVVERVFQLNMDAYQLGFGFLVIDGRLSVINKDNAEPPESLLDDAEEIYDDMFELSERVVRACGRVVTGFSQ
jgi:hypothetical protein